MHDIDLFRHRRNEALNDLIKAELNLMPELNQFLSDKGFALADSRIDESGLITQEWVKSSTERSVP